jgi:hypothetical protein
MSKCKTKLRVTKLQLSVLKFCTLMAFTGFSCQVFGQIDFEKPPVNYGQTESQDAVAQLVKKMAAGEVQLNYDPRLGWLPSLLSELNIDVESQVLVFSKTSLQLHKINPRQPRALYFNDDVYVGFCQNGEVLEIAATDPQLGAVFYTLDQADDARQIVADRGQCLTCHATNRTANVPGYLVRSVYSDFNGRPRSGTRTFVTDHSTDFSNRFGGWYVSGQHGHMRHLGNIVAKDRLDPEKMECDAGANIDDLSKLFNTQPYLSAHSDLVALMVLEHQSQMHNLLARASMETRSALHHDAGINEALGRAMGTLSESTERRIARAAEDVVSYMLLTGEIALDSPISGSTEFAKVFSARSSKIGQVDSQGRSLRDLDLQTRLFKYACSYMIYSDAFKQLPELMYEKIRQRMYQVLSAEEPVAGYERLSAADRQAVLQILSETAPALFKGLGSSTVVLKSN